MIRTRPEGRATDIKQTKAKSNVKKMSLSKSESDKSSSPNKVKISSGSPKKIKTPPSSPAKTSVKMETSPVSTQASDTSSNTQKVNLDINLIYMYTNKNGTK